MYFQVIHQIKTLKFYFNSLAFLFSLWFNKKISKIAEARPMKGNADKHVTHSLLVFHLVLGFFLWANDAKKKKFNLRILNLSHYSSHICAVLSLKIQMLKPPSEIINLMPHSKSVLDHRHFRALASSLLLFFLPQHFKYCHCSGLGGDGRRWE